MRIWYLHPENYDKKGILAQWNEGIILKNIIYGTKHRLTIEKQKLKAKKQLPSSKSKTQEELGKTKEKEIINNKKSSDVSVRNLKSLSRSKKAPSSSKTTSKPRQVVWENHPFAKRVTRYHLPLQKKIINTYLYNLRIFGVDHFGIKFNEEYIDLANVDEKLKIPILLEHIEKDKNDALLKMEERDEKVLNFIKSIKKTEDFKLLKPYYYERDFSVYLNALNDDYFHLAEGNFNKLIGTEIEFNSNENEFRINKINYNFENLMKVFKKTAYNESEYFIERKENSTINTNILINSFVKNKTLKKNYFDKKHQYNSHIKIQSKSLEPLRLQLRSSVNNKRVFESINNNRENNYDINYFRHRIRKDNSTYLRRKN